MDLLINNTLSLWHEVIRNAENRCSISLDEDLEAYLVSLMIRYTNQPEVVKQILATTFLDALQKHSRERDVSLQHVGDQCLIFAGLFPHSAAKKQVKVKYFVDLGRSAYSSISQTTNDLFGSLAFQFVALMDVLQSIHQKPQLLPLEAYEQWEMLGSKRAYQILHEYSDDLTIKLKNK